MPDYSKGKIYKIVCNETGLVYIGSTTQELNIRLNQHKSHQNCVSREIIKNNNYNVEVIEDVNASTKLELLQRERYWIENSECINYSTPSKTIKEWYQENKEKVKEKSKQYREENREYYIKQQKEYYETNKEKFKQYREENKEKKNQQSKDWRKKNKEKVKQYNKEYSKKYYQQKKLQMTSSSDLITSSSNP